MSNNRRADFQFMCAILNAIIGSQWGPAGVFVMFAAGWIVSGMWYDYDEDRRNK